MVGESGKSGTSKSADRRAERLKAALRENLRRRKVQARGRNAQKAAEPPGKSAPKRRDDDD